MGPLAPLLPSLKGYGGANRDRCLNDMRDGLRE